MIDDTPPYVKCPPCPACGAAKGVEVPTAWPNNRQWRCACGNEHWMTEAELTGPSEEESDA